MKKQSDKQEVYDYGRAIRLLLQGSSVEKQHDLYFEALQIKESHSPGFRYQNLDRNNFKFVHKQILALRSLFDQSSAIGRRNIVAELLNILANGNDSSSSFVIKSLVMLGQTDKVIGKVFEDFSSYEQEQYLNYFSTVSFLLAYLPELFSVEQKNRIYDWVEDYFNGRSEVGQKYRKNLWLYRKFSEYLGDIRNLLSILLSEKLISDIYSSFNPEINLDQKKLVAEFNRYNFPQDLSESLDKVESYLSDAKDGFDYGSCQKLLRSFTERMFRSIAIELDPKDGANTNTEDSQVLSKFYISKGLISKSEADLLIGIRHFLSNMGTHRLKSAPEETRLIKNMLIEYSLYLIERLRVVKLKNQT